MKKITYLLTLIGLITITCGEEKSFVCEVKSPNIKIEIPGVPQIEMKDHPLHKTKPHLLLAGEKDGYIISISAPTADKGMTAEECAKALAGALLKQHSLDQTNSFFGPAGKDTYQFRFILSIGDGMYQMNSHILSGYEGSHCVNVHISKITKQKDDFDAWLKGFPEAVITNMNKPTENIAPQPNKPTKSEHEKPLK